MPGADSPQELMKTRNIRISISNNAVLGDDNEMFNPYYSGNGDTVYRLLSG